MELRFTTEPDVKYVAEHSVSRTILNDMPGQRTWTYTLADEERVLGLGGVEMITPNTAWAWIDVTDEVTHADWYSVYRIIGEWSDQICKDLGITRLQAYVECDFDVARRFIEHMGFEWESTMKNFVGDKDADMYVKYMRVE